MTLVGPDASLPYDFTGTVERWVDGDTLWANVSKDIGFHIVISALQDFRLYGINTQEKGEPLYSQAKDRVNQLAPPGSAINVQSYKDADNFGRWIAIIWVGDIGTGTNINQTLVDEGLAVPYYGGPKNVT